MKKMLMDKMPMMNRPGDPCKTVCRQTQPKVNPSPNMTPEAMAAAKAAQRNTEKQTVNSMVKGIVQRAATTVKQGSTQNAQVLADRRDQERKLKDEY